MARKKENDFANIRFQAIAICLRFLPGNIVICCFLAKAETNLKRLSISVLKLIIQDILSIHHHWEYQEKSYLVLALK